MLSRHTPSITSTVIALLFSSFATSEHTHQRMHKMEKRQTASLTSQGCFSSAGGGLESQPDYTWQSSSHCGNACAALQKPVMALSGGNQCTCGDLLPSSSDKASSSDCSDPCTGFDQEMCGGPSAYTVFLTGVDDDVGTVSSGGSNSEDTQSSVMPSIEPSSIIAPPSIIPSSSPVPQETVVQHVTEEATITSARTRVARPTTVVQNHQTIVRTLAPSVQTVQGPAATENPAPQSGSVQKDNANSTSGSTIGIAVGVVVGVVLLAAIAIIAVFYIRRRRRLKNAENGHARADSLNAFVASGGSLPGMPMANDTRLDPRVMVEKRRQSAGSVFADDQDYSRRILKVANPNPDDD